MAETPLYRRVARRLRRGAARSHIPGRGAAENRLDTLAERVDKHSDRLNVQGQRLDRQLSRIDKIDARLKADGNRYAPLNLAVRIMQHQVGALEARLADVTDDVRAAALSNGSLPEGTASGELEPLDPEWTQAPPDVVAKRVLAEIRAEHARIRVRFQLLSEYEERIRRLEATIASALPEVAKA